MKLLKYIDEHSFGITATLTAIAIVAGLYFGLVH